MSSVHVKRNQPSLPEQQYIQPPSRQAVNNQLARLKQDARQLIETLPSVPRSSRREVETQIAVIRQEILKLTQAQTSTAVWTPFFDGPENYKSAGIRWREIGPNDRKMINKPVWTLPEGTRFELSDAVFFKQEVSEFTSRPSPLPPNIPVEILGRTNQINGVRVNVAGRGMVISQGIHGFIKRLGSDLEEPASLWQVSFQQKYESGTLKITTPSPANNSPDIFEWNVMPGKAVSYLLQLLVSDERGDFGCTLSGYGPQADGSATQIVGAHKYFEPISAFG